MDRSYQLLFCDRGFFRDRSSVSELVSRQCNISSFGHDYQAPANSISLCHQFTNRPRKSSIQFESGPWCIQWSSQRFLNFHAFSYKLVVIIPSEITPLNWLKRFKLNFPNLCHNSSLLTRRSSWSSMFVLFVVRALRTNKQLEYQPPLLGCSLRSSDLRLRSCRPLQCIRLLPP